MTGQDVAELLGAALQQQTEERRDFLICFPDEAPDYYVQFPHPGDSPAVLYAEAVSDAYLPPDLAVGEEGAKALSRLGWNAPTSETSTSLTGWDEARGVWVSPNWFREFNLDDDHAYRTIADTILETLHAVYGYADGRLRIELGSSDRAPALVRIYDPSGTTTEEWSVAEEAPLPVATRSFSADQDNVAAPSSYEWFESLSDVPGVDWAVPPGAEDARDQRLVSARPVADPDSYSRSGIAWVDPDGSVLADDFSRDQSPAELMLEGRYEQARDAEVVTRTVATALALPGTRHDYHTALEWLARTEGIDPGLIERALLADVQLIAGNPRAALNSPRWGDREDSLAAAGYPAWRLVALYLSEGFLTDALRVEAMLDALPEEARTDYRLDQITRVREGLEALRT